MENENLVLAIACMSMFAMEQKNENYYDNSSMNSELNKIKKDIAK